MTTKKSTRKHSNKKKEKSKELKTRTSIKTRKRTHRTKEWINAVEAARARLIRTGSIVDAKRALIMQRYHNVVSLFGAPSS